MDPQAGMWAMARTHFWKLPTPAALILCFRMFGAGGNLHLGQLWCWRADTQQQGSSSLAARLQEEGPKPPAHPTSALFLAPLRRSHRNCWFRVSHGDSREQCQPPARGISPSLLAGEPEFVSPKTEEVQIHNSYFPGDHLNDEIIDHGKTGAKPLAEGQRPPGSYWRRVNFRGGILPTTFKSFGGTWASQLTVPKGMFECSSAGRSFCCQPSCYPGASPGAGWCRTVAGGTQPSQCFLGIISGIFLLHRAEGTDPSGGHPSWVFKFPYPKQGSWAWLQLVWTCLCDWDCLLGKGRVKAVWGWEWTARLNVAILCTVF